MKFLFLIFVVGVIVVSNIARAQEDFFDGLIVSEEMKKEEIGLQGQEKARQLLESKPTILKVQQKKVRVEKVNPEEKIPVIRAPAPFGLKWLATIDEIKYLSVRLRRVEIKDTPNSYVATNLPNPVSAFREILLSFGDNDALWRISAYGNFINDDESASKGLAEYEKYYQILSKKYGNPHQFYSPAVVNVDETVTADDGAQTLISRQEKMELGAKGFLQKLVEGESTLYATFDNGHVGVTLALMADGRGQTYIVVDYKNLTATKQENDELYQAL